MREGPPVSSVPWVNLLEPYIKVDVLPLPRVKWVLSSLPGYGFFVCVCPLLVRILKDRRGALGPQTANAVVEHYLFLSMTRDQQSQLHVSSKVKTLETISEPSVMSHLHLLRFVPQLQSVLTPANLSL